MFEIRFPLPDQPLANVFELSRVHLDVTRATQASVARRIRENVFQLPLGSSTSPAETGRFQMRELEPHKRLGIRAALAPIWENERDSRLQSFPPASRRLSPLRAFPSSLREH